MLRKKSGSPTLASSLVRRLPRPFLTPIVKSTRGIADLFAYSECAKEKFMYTIHAWRLPDSILHSLVKAAADMSGRAELLER